MADRTDKDYAIEHAGYLADAAEDYLDARNRYEQIGGPETGDDDLLSDHIGALRSAIYEFRKRAARCTETV
jgi:hypothetical protein